jgi:hypothetical protein
MSFNLKPNVNGRKRKGQVHHYDRKLRYMRYMATYKANLLAKQKFMDQHGIFYVKPIKHKRWIPTDTWDMIPIIGLNLSPTQ